MPSMKKAKQRARPGRETTAMALAELETFPCGGGGGGGAQGEIVTHIGVAKLDT